MLSAGAITEGMLGDEASPPAMVAIKTPPPIPGESAPADCRRHPHGNPKKT